MRPPRFEFVILIVGVGLLAGCPGEPSPETSDVREATKDVASDVPSDTNLRGDGGTDSAIDGTARDDADIGRDASWPPDVRDFPPFVVGPPPKRFDCRAAGEHPERRSPVPLACVTDPNCSEPMVVGHRGAGGSFGVIAPENSLSAIRAAIIMGVDGIELDVRHTSDDKVVLMHDDTVDRTTKGSGEVAEMTAGEVTKLHLKKPDEQAIGDFSCSTVPTLAEAFELTRDEVFIDLDTKTDRVDLLVDAITKADLEDQVFISTSSVSKAERARKRDSSIRIQVRPDTQKQLDDALERFNRTPDVVEIPSDRVAAFQRQIHSAGGKVFADVFERDARAAGGSDPDPYTELYDRGADILQSEFPSLVLKALGR